MNQVIQYQQTLQSTIENATSIEELTPYLKYIDFDKIKHRLIDTLHQEISHQTPLLIKIYFSSNSIVDILSLDVTKHCFRYLETKDIFGTLSRVNKQFHQICKSKDNYAIRKYFYQHELFSMWFLKSSCIRSNDDGEEEVYVSYDNEGDAVYYLQHEYDSSTLNKFCKAPFQDLGSILKGADWLVWRVCTIFELNTRLLGNLIDDRDGWSMDVYANCFENLTSDYESLESGEIECFDDVAIRWPEYYKPYEYKTQNDIAVIAHYGWRKRFTLRISPVLFIEFPEEERWFQKFEKVLNDFGLLVDEEDNA